MSRRFESHDIERGRGILVCAVIAGLLGYTRPGLAGDDPLLPLSKVLQAKLHAQKPREQVTLVAECLPRVARGGTSSPAPQLLDDVDELRKRQSHARARYADAMALLGGEHTLFTAGPLAYKQCERAVRCDRSVPWSGDLALWAALPLWGLGGGHGSDWFPVLETTDQADSHRLFAELLTEYSERVSVLAKHDVAESDLEAHVAELRASVHALAEAGYERDVQHFELARSIVECLDYEQSSNIVTSVIAAARAECDRAEKDLQKAVEDRAKAVTDGTEAAATAKAVEDRTRAVAECEEVLEEHARAVEAHAYGALRKAGRVREQFRIIAGPDAAFTPVGDRLCSVCGGEPLSASTLRRERLLREVAELNSLIRMLTDHVVPAKRHALLTGPTFGVPLTRDPLSAFYLGAIVELGGWVSVSVGTLGAYEDLAFFNGFFVGVGLSGAPADDLWHFMNGGQNASRELEEASW